MLVIAAFFSQLVACLPERDTEPTLVTPETAEAPTSPELVGKPFNESEGVYPESTVVLWADGFLWTANESGLLTRWDVQTQNYKQYRLPDESVIRALASDGETLYAGTDGGDVWQLVGDDPPTQIKDSASNVSPTRKEEWETHHLMDNTFAGRAPSLAIADDNTVWVAAESYIAQKTRGKWQTYNVIDNPLLTDRVRFVVLDDEDHPWFIGRRGKIHFDGDTWIAYDADVRRFAVFTPMPPPEKITPPPLDFPSPAQDHDGWLQSWPRPKADNGRCIHFLQTHQFDAIEAQRHVNRMRSLGMRWTVVHYADHEQLVRTAPIFQDAGITVMWRPFVRPYETYPSWAEDVEYLRSRGLAPYFQLYNEPSLNQEWQDAGPINQETYTANLLNAAREVYNAGGYVGLQSVDPDWLRLTLQAIETRGMNDILDRLFFIPHPYGLNHPPEYNEDINSALGFREFATVFEEEIGFVPVMIAGEGGWRPGEAQDNRYPAISEELHRDYHLAVFNWFQTGQLSDGQPLPDYFFAFCPWLISDPHDPAAWFDSNTGDRTLTIQAVEALSSFEREFSWDR